MRFPADAVGLSVFRGGSFQGLGLFDKHATLQHSLPPLIDSYAIDLFGTREREAAESAKASYVANWVLAEAAFRAWEKFGSPGEGEDWRFDSDWLTGAALVTLGRVGHSSSTVPDECRDRSQSAA